MPPAGPSNKKPSYWVTRGPAGLVRVYTADYLAAALHTNIAPTSIRAWHWMGRPPSRLGPLTCPEKCSVGWKHKNNTAMHIGRVKSLARDTPGRRIEARPAQASVGMALRPMVLVGFRDLRSRIADRLFSSTAAWSRPSISSFLFEFAD